MSKFPDIPPIAYGTYLPTGIELEIAKEEDHRRQMDNLEQISVDAKKQIEIMEEQLKLQKEECDSAKKQSRISLIISIIAVIATILSSISEQLFALLGI